MNKNKYILITYNPMYGMYNPVDSKLELMNGHKCAGFILQPPLAVPFGGTNSAVEHHLVGHKQYATRIV